MELTELSKRANQIRQKYSDLNKTKNQKEWTGINYMEGFVGDIGALMKIIMTKEGYRGDVENVDQKLDHQLADCLWCVLVLSKMYDVDLEKSFMKTMDELEEYIDKEIET